MEWNKLLKKKKMKGNMIIFFKLFFYIMLGSLWNNEWKIKEIYKFTIVGGRILVHLTLSIMNLLMKKSTASAWCMPSFSPLEETFHAWQCCVPSSVETSPKTDLRKIKISTHDQPWGWPLGHEGFHDEQSACENANLYILE